MPGPGVPVVGTTEGNWKCACGNVNWGRRDICNRCQTAKPAKKVQKTKQDEIEELEQQRDKERDAAREARRAKEKSRRSSKSDDDDPAALHAALLNGKTDSRSRSASRSKSKSRSPSTSPEPQVDRAVGVHFDDLDDSDIRVTGPRDPRDRSRDEPPCEVSMVQTFQESKLHEKLMTNLSAQKFDRPTPVQKWAIPIIRGGYDLLASAQTGSGKTLAFLVPIIHNILSGTGVMRPYFSGKMAQASPLALILAPTRELIQQIHVEAEKLCAKSGLTTKAIYGGENLILQTQSLQDVNTDILCATPGRLLDMIKSGTVTLNFVAYLIFDEADKMMDLGFEKSIRKVVTEMDLPLKEKRQTVMFSATLPSSIMKLVNEFMRPHYRLSIGQKGSASKNIKQVVKAVSPQAKNTEMLADLEACPGISIVFVEKHKTCDILRGFLEQRGHNAVAIHGKHEQWVREEAIAKIKSGAAKVLVGTSVAARGLDIPQVAQVINYDLPRDVGTYTHRIGRTGRAGFEGLAVSYFTPQDRSLGLKLCQVLTDSEQVLPPWLAEQSGWNNRRRDDHERGRRRSGSKSRDRRDYGDRSRERERPRRDRRDDDRREDYGRDREDYGRDRERDRDYDRGRRDDRDYRDTRDSHGSRNRERDSRDPRERDSRDPHSRDSRDYRDSRDSRDLRERDSRDSRDARDRDSGRGDDRDHRDRGQKEKGVPSIGGTEGNWKCGCGNVNWGRRHKCNRCQAAKEAAPDSNAGAASAAPIATSTEYSEYPAQYAYDPATYQAAYDQSSASYPPVQYDAYGQPINQGASWQ